MAISDTIKNTTKSLRNIASVLAGFTRMGVVKFFRKRKILNKNSFDDVMVISYPKSGRTWLRVMLDYLDINLRYEHKFVDFEAKAIEKYNNKRIIFLIRDPRDTVVSSYFQALKREQVYEGAMSDFIRSHEFGIKKILDYLNFWISNKNIPKKFMVMTYEDMHENTVKSLEKILTFLEVTSIDKHKLEDTVELFRFDNMQNLEKKGILGLRYGNVLRPIGNKDSDSLKVRRGVVGGYVDYLSEEDIQYCNKCMKNSDLGYYPTSEKSDNKK